MATTIIFPIQHILLINNEGDYILHPAIKLRPIITEDNGNVRIEAKYFFTTDNQSFVEIELGKDNIDSPYDETVIFTGFYSTAKEIIQELQVPEKDVDWVN